MYRGGEEVLLDVGGQDSTEAFEDVGHSDEAREILDGLLVGNLKRQVRYPPPLNPAHITRFLSLLLHKTTSPRHITHLHPAPPDAARRCRSSGQGTSSERFRPPCTETKQPVLRIHKTE